MKITEPALAELKKLLSDNGADGLEVVLQQTCCGVSPAFQMVRFDENDKPEDVDGVMILADDPRAKESVKDVIIDLQNGELVVFNPVCGCGGHDHGDDHECCGGHGHDHGDDHECCGGHGHDHGDDHECCGGHGGCNH